MEFLAEEETAFDPDEDFFEVDTRKGREGQRRMDRPIGGRLYLAMPDVGALRQLISLSAEVPEAIVHALRLDLIGPWPDHPLADERLPGWVRPSNWYLTGFLVPRGAPVEQRGDADVDDEPEVAERGGSAT